MHNKASISPTSSQVIGWKIPIGEKISSASWQVDPLRQSGQNTIRGESGNSIFIFAK
jgi:hypothetical protein